VGTARTGSVFDIPDEIDSVDSIVESSGTPVCLGTGGATQRIKSVFYGLEFTNQVSLMGRLFPLTE